MGRQIVMLPGHSQVPFFHDRGVVTSTEQLALGRKKSLGGRSAVIKLLLLILCASAGSNEGESQTGLTHNTAPNQVMETNDASLASSQHGFSITVFTSPDDQFWPNSVIIEGVHEVMLVDAQLASRRCAPPSANRSNRDGTPRPGRARSH